MNTVNFKNVTIQIVTIMLCNLIGSGFSAPQFDFARPIYSGIKKAFTPVSEQDNAETPSSNPFGAFNPFSSKDNIFNSNKFPTLPSADQFVNNFKKILPHGIINRFKNNKDSAPDGSDKLNSREFFGSDDDSLFKSAEETEKTVPEGTEDSLLTLTWQDMDMSDDDTTESSEYEATTDDEGHISGPLPAVVASLLG